MQEPNWAGLADIQFLIYKRVADSLNAALSAVALSDMPDAGGQSPVYWKQRATNKIANVLNLFTAWEYLLRYKVGESIPERAVRPFPVNTLLVWLAQQLQLTTTPAVEGDPVLSANQETLQEALLLLYSAAFTQGTNVRLEMETNASGMWFRIKFSRKKPMPETIDELLASFGDHWRAQDTVFELATARDFVGLNDSELILRSSPNSGEFAFFIWRSGVKRRAAVAGAVQEHKAVAESSTAVIREGDLPEGNRKPTTKELQASDPTPVMPPPVEPRPVRLADLTPAHFPLPPDSFAPGDGTDVASQLEEKTSEPDRTDTPAATPEEPGHATVSRLGDETPLMRPGPVRTPELSRNLVKTGPLAGDKRPQTGSLAKPPKSGQEQNGGAIIVPANVPEPKLPSSMHRPPAATSHGAVHGADAPVARPTPHGQAAPDQAKPEAAAPAGDQAAAPSSDSDTHADFEAPGESENA